MIATSALREGILRFTPVGVLNLWARGALVGLQVSAILGMPTLLLIWAIVGNKPVTGISWVIFKGIWPAFVAIPIIAIVFLSAVDERHFSDHPSSFIELEDTVASIQ